MPTTCFVACAVGLEKILHSELKSLGVKKLRIRRAGVDCVVTIREIYRICLWSRVANRVLYPLLAFKVSDEKSYYAGLFQHDWAMHLSQSGSLAVDFFAAESVITHSQYGAQLTKDAVVDWFRERTGERPTVDRQTPDVRINVYLYKNRARVSLDMAGSSLHRRNYRQQGGLAPLKENLAAALLLASDWPSMARSGVPLLDPMCGSGTFLIEGAMIAANIAPGSKRRYFGFLGWKQHDNDAWTEIKAEAEAQRNNTSVSAVAGFDIDSKAVAAARSNIQAAGLADLIEVEQADFTEVPTPFSRGPGLLMMNPPYGERLEKNPEIGVFYSRVGRSLRWRAGNWRLALFTGNPALFHRTGLSRRVALECSNGGIDCRLFLADIPPPAMPGNPDDAVSENKPAFNPWLENSSPDEKPVSPVEPAVEPSQVPGLDQFRHRLQKNIRQIKGWLKSAGISNYRLYDADLPDYAFALDVFCDAETSDLYVCMQEYRAPRHIDPRLAQRRIDNAASVVVSVLGCSVENLAIKRREQQRAESQYARLQKRDQYHEVHEGDARLLINLHDYLDVGLFLDHRKVRLWLANSCRDKHVLNLYCYTASATVHAILGGARKSISVDKSNKYIAWAAKNFSLNDIPFDKHELVHADCRQWLSQYQKGTAELFDLIFLDPPTFSNSSSMDQDWDVQRDHRKMIEDCMSILKPDGILVFSNNFKRFKLAVGLNSLYDVQDRSRWSLQRDFARNPRIHQCWFIRHKQAV
ncbi:23S rRNA (guanine(2445)-N(2))/(guanine(2069)-N(7))-methyltransferase [Chromatiales bacterium (ex Bugula neritina AB1)]|nr:23S rRNA (guanine(2445)-N(2))/(guanine(2069)-N(7))-methyltransferase [Chromatiales bacterium (ex Bugula neritina AB1)]